MAPKMMYGIQVEVIIKHCQCFERILCKYMKQNRDIFERMYISEKVLSIQCIADGFIIMSQVCLALLTYRIRLDH